MIEDENTPRGMARQETWAIPTDIREQIDERDGQYCRVCGKYLGQERALHHILYGGPLRGMGGRRVHAVDEIITVCWMWGGNCHDRVHGEKRLWQPILLELTERPGLTGLQLLRWKRARE